MKSVGFNRTDDPYIRKVQGQFELQAELQYFPDQVPHTNCCQMLPCLLPIEGTPIHFVESLYTTNLLGIYMDMVYIYVVYSKADHSPFSY